VNQAQKQQFIDVLIAEAKNNATLYKLAHARHNGSKQALQIEYETYARDTLNKIGIYRYSTFSIEKVPYAGVYKLAGSVDVTDSIDIWVYCTPIITLKSGKISTAFHDSSGFSLAFLIDNAKVII